MAYAPLGAPDGSFLETVLFLSGGFSPSGFSPLARGKYRCGFLINPAAGR